MYALNLQQNNNNNNNRIYFIKAQIRAQRPKRNRVVIVRKTEIISDPDSRILNLVAKWPGSTHDAFMLSQSSVPAHFQAGPLRDVFQLGKYCC